VNSQNNRSAVTRTLTSAADLPAAREQPGDAAAVHRLRSANAAAGGRVWGAADWADHGPAAGGVWFFYVFFSDSDMVRLNWPWTSCRWDTVFWVNATRELHQCPTAVRISECASVSAHQW